MSTQSAQSAIKSAMYLDSLDGSSMSNSQIVQATDEAFSLHKRLDIGYNYDCHGTVSVNPLDDPSNSRLQMKKRKKSFGSARSDFAASDFKTDFLSGIFRDLSQAEEENKDDSCAGSPSVSVITNADDQISGCVSDDDYIHIRKRAKTADNLNAFRRSRRSLACLVTLADVSQSEHSQLSPIMTTQEFPSPTNTCNKLATQSRRVSVGSQKSSFSSSGSPNQATTLDAACNLIDDILDASLVFPRLPPSVSESSCNSSNLTQTSVQAAQVHETTAYSLNGEVHHNKDTYGWFVDTDVEEHSVRAEAITAAQESCRVGSDEDLSFKAQTAPKKSSVLDEEVEWAKAADTVDEVLGDLF